MSRPGDGEFASSRGFRSLKGAIFGVACFVATLTGVVVLSLLLAAVVAAAMKRPGAHPWYDLLGNARELSRFLWALIGNKQSRKPEIAGFRAGVVGSCWLLFLVASIALPIGVGSAVYLEEYIRPGRWRSIIQTNIANLAGVPSIVYGILGLAVFVRAFGFASVGFGKVLWAGGLTLSLLVLPVIVITTQEALRAVPGSLRQAAMALGATKWQVIRDHVLPSALPGILTGAILALSRAIGETAPLLMVGAAGAIYRIPSGPSSRYTALPVEIYNYAKEPGIAFQAVAAGGILILLLLLLTMNGAAILIRNRYGRSAGA